jgi:hypothetical protein
MQAKTDGFLLSLSPSLPFSFSTLPTRLSSMLFDARSVTQAIVTHFSHLTGKGQILKFL